MVRLMSPFGLEELDVLQELDVSCSGTKTSSRNL